MLTYNEIIDCISFVPSFIKKAKEKISEDDVLLNLEYAREKLKNIHELVNTAFKCGLINEDDCDACFELIDDYKKDIELTTYYMAGYRKALSDYNVDCSSKLGKR